MFNVSAILVPVVLHLSCFSRVFRSKSQLTQAILFSDFPLLDGWERKVFLQFCPNFPPGLAVIFISLADTDAKIRNKFTRSDPPKEEIAVEIAA